MSFGLPAGPARRRVRWLVVIALAFACALASCWWAWARARTPGRLREELREAVEAGRWAKAAVLSRRLTELDPSDGHAWLTRARAAEALGDPKASARWLAEMPAENPEKTQALRGLVELQLGPLNAPFAAEQSLRQLLEREPRSEFAHQRLIFFYALTLQRQKLVRQVRQAFEMQCEPIEAYTYLFFTDSLHFTNGPALNQRWLSSEPSSELFRVATAIHVATALEGGPVRDDEAEVLQFRKMADRRERVLSDLFAKYPRNVELLAWHIDRAIRQGDLGRVIALLKTVPPESDADNRFLRFAGWVEARLDHEEEALACYTRALELHPLDWNTRHLIAQLRRKQLKFDEVGRLEKLVQTADELRRELDVAPDASSVPDEVLARLADYAEQCGDDSFATSLRRRLAAPAAGNKEGAGSS